MNKDNQPHATCGAKTRNGGKCKSPPCRGKTRCRMHGGAKGSGAPKGNLNALKHGRYSRQLNSEFDRTTEIFNLLNGAILATTAGDDETAQAKYKEARELGWCPARGIAAWETTRQIDDKTFEQITHEVSFT